MGAPDRRAAGEGGSRLAHTDRPEQVRPPADNEGPHDTGRRWGHRPMTTSLPRTRPPSATWAEQQITALAPDTDLPLYGSEQWAAAPEHVRRASAIRAAEAWRRDGETLADRLQAETFAAQAEQVRHHELEYLEWLPIAQRVTRGGPAYAELAARRAVIPPGTGTYRGGPVPWC